MRKLIVALAAGLLAAGCQNSSNRSATEHAQGASNNDVGASVTPDRSKSADQAAVQPNPTLNDTTATNTPPAGQMQGVGQSGSQTPEMQAKAMPGQMPTEMFTPAMVVNRLHAINQEEIEAGNLAKKNGQKSVAGFGETLVRDHQQLDKQVSSAAQQLKVQLQDPSKVNWPQPVMQDMHADQQMMDQLKGMKGSDFDKQYLTMMVHGHQKALDYLKQVQGNTQSEVLKKLAVDAAPKIQAHHDMAEQLLNQEGGRVEGKR